MASGLTLTRWATVVVVAAVVGASLVWFGSTPKSRADDGSGRHWPSGVSARSLRDLTEEGWSLTPPGGAMNPRDEASAVTAAVSMLGWLETSKARTVTPVTARNTNPNAPPLAQKAAAMWVIEFDDVVVPDLSGKGTNGNPGGMVVLVDADTLKMVYASSD